MDSADDTLVNDVKTIVNVEIKSMYRIFFFIPYSPFCFSSEFLLNYILRNLRILMTLPHIPIKVPIAKIVRDSCQANGLNGSNSTKSNGMLPLTSVSK